MGRFLKWFYWKSLAAYLHVYYRLKAGLLSLLVGEQALAYVLHDSLFPRRVLKIGGARIGTNVRVGRWMTLHESRGTFKNLEVGNDVWIGNYVLIDLSDKVKLGNRTGLGMWTMVITHESFGDSVLSKDHPKITAPVEIMDDSIVGWGCIVNKGTKVLPRAIVLPGTVISGVIGLGVKCGGNPARIIPMEK